MKRVIAEFQAGSILNSGDVHRPRRNTPEGEGDALAGCKLLPPEQPILSGLQSSVRAAASGRKRICANWDIASIGARACGGSRPITRRSSHADWSSASSPPKRRIEGDASTITTGVKCGDTGIIGPWLNAQHQVVDIGLQPLRLTALHAAGVAGTMVADMAIAVATARRAAATAATEAGPAAAVRGRAGQGRGQVCRIRLPKYCP